MRLLLSVVVLLLGFSTCVSGTAEPTARITNYEPVRDFVVSETRDQLSFRAYGRLWTFHIWLTDVRVDNQAHFFGRLVGAEEKGLSSFTLLPDYVTGMILFNNETFWLEAKDPTAPLDLYIYRSSDVLFAPGHDRLNCGHSGKPHTHGSMLGPRDVNAYVVFIDQYWAASSYGSEDQIFGLLNDVNMVYGASGLSGFVYELGGTRNNAWTTYETLNNMLTDLSAHWKAHSQSGKNAIWLAGNNVGGLAWIGTACQRNPYYNTAVAGLNIQVRLWTVKTIAHELGHNRGANHDFTNQCESKQSSGCQCSVMSYCFPTRSTSGGEQNYFSQTSINEIKNTCN